MFNIIFSKILPNGFNYIDITTKELEKLIVDAVKKEFPNNNTKDIKYDIDKIIITLDNDDEIEIKIDWNEINLILD